MKKKALQPNTWTLENNEKKVNLYSQKKKSLNEIN
jgi:hypothetical protein